MTDMNNPNDPNRGGYGGWPQQPHQPQQPYPPRAQQQHPQQHPHPQQSHVPPQQPGHPSPYGFPVDDAAATTVMPPVPAFDDAAATTLMPPVPAVDDAEVTALLPPVVVSGSVPVAPPRSHQPHQQQFQPQPRPHQPQQPRPYQQPPQQPHQFQQPQPPQQQPHQSRQQRRRQSEQPEQSVQPQPDPTIQLQLQQPSRPRARHAAPAAQPAPAPQPAEAFDPPTMTLKRPTAPGVPGPAGASGPLGVPAAAPFPAVPPHSASSAGPRGRTGSPIIDPGLQPALITAGAAALLAGGAALGQVALALVVALLQLLTAAGWFRLNGMWPARQGILLAALAGFTADVAVLLADSDGGVAAVVGTLGGFFLLVLVLQTFRPSDPKERFYALTVLGSATVVTALCTMLLLADWVPAAVGAVALATLLAAAPLPGPKQLGPVLGLAAAVVLGLLVGAPVALGALAGLGALVGRRVAAYDFPSRFVHMTAGVALPLAVAAPLIWIATELLA
ncbi:hypothetical protein ACFWJ4_24305 [Kitasatospora sp. NPDC127067]|uniref:hypothetical protein n=1 Tax=Kitasatospora sp. NPDC127067 TaxID=3347126 RepID=UPI003651627D